MGSDPRNEMKSNSVEPFAKKVPGLLLAFWTVDADESGRISLRKPIYGMFGAEEPQR